MQCELCGREANCKPALVDGVRMMLCPSCMRHGKGIEIAPESSLPTKKSVVGRIRKSKEKDVYEDMKTELVSGWNKIIKDARERKNLTREELGFRIGERTVTISKIENGDLRPSDKVVKKLEKELDIKLVEKVEGISSRGLSTTSSSGRGLTLGDFIKRE